MSKNRRANSVSFGFDFQVNAAIILMLENIKELRSLKLEGNYEDIELQLNDGEYILAQAKSVEHSSKDFKNVRKKLKEALVTLSEGYQKAHNTRSLILITNSPNPLNEDASMSLFYGHAHRSFSSLPNSSQQLILDYLTNISEPLDVNQFQIQVVPFETDDDRERYKVVRQVVDDFIGDLNLNIAGIGNKLLGLWHEDVFKNSTKDDPDIKLSKKDIIWPILVIATDVERCDDSFAEQFDAGLYDEIAHQYASLIDSCCERFEFFIQVLCDYNSFQCDKSNAEKCVEFAMTKWPDYVSRLKLVNADEETQRGLVQIVLYNIVRNRFVINKVKRGVNL